MINALLHHAQVTSGRLSTGSDPWRPGIIHRLDRDTTGIILVAKTDEAHWRLAGQFERRTIRKTYLAIVHGQPPLDSDLIDAPIGLHPQNREKMAVRKDSGRPAQTVYTVVERFEDFSLVELAPKTGRTHQLRVHMAFIGHPMAGDVDYGGRVIHGHELGIGGEKSVIIDRQALHAFRLQFVHPTEYRRMLVEAPLPPDMTNFLTMLRRLRR
jgi:23S rRNA pseudouridine1911/1915/1917 synthase